MRYLKDDHELLNYISDKEVFLVCSNSFKKTILYSDIKDTIKKYGRAVIEFDEFSPNPKYEEITKGIELIKRKPASIIIAAGGGSAIDVAKCIKGYCSLNDYNLFFTKQPVKNDIELIAIPTTAGSGSEATQFAVLYYCKEKQSIDNKYILPSTTYMKPELLKTLPLYQKKSTLFDAYCHAIESCFSVECTEESREYAYKAINLITSNYKAYFLNQDDANESIMKAANFAGMAINITRTTAGHAMAYKLTMIYGISHGHAVALCLEALWKYICDSHHRTHNFIDELSAIMDEYLEIFSEMNFDNPLISDDDIAILKDSVNVERMKNFPIKLSELEIEKIYRYISR